MEIEKLNIIKEQLEAKHQQNESNKKQVFL